MLEQYVLLSLPQLCFVTGDHSGCYCRYKFFTSCHQSQAQPHPSRTNQLLGSDNNHFPYSEQWEQNTAHRGSENPNLSHTADKMGPPSRWEWTHLLSKCWISLHYIGGCWEMLFLHFLVSSLVTVCASKFSRCQQLKKCGCQCVNAK